MQFPSRRARITLLAGVGTLAVAAPASAAVTSDYNTTTKVLTVSLEASDNLEAGDIACVGNNIKVNGADPNRDGAPGGPTGCVAPTELAVTAPDASDCRKTRVSPPSVYTIVSSSPPLATDDAYSVPGTTLNTTSGTVSSRTISSPVVKVSGRNVDPW